jgi:hypothetical protein
VQGEQPETLPIKVVPSYHVGDVNTSWLPEKIVLSSATADGADTLKLHVAVIADAET